jgi:hypothetical protein
LMIAHYEGHLFVLEVHPWTLRAPVANSTTLDIESGHVSGMCFYSWILSIVIDFYDNTCLGCMAS